MSGGMEEKEGLRIKHGVLGRSFARRGGKHCGRERLGTAVLNPQKKLRCKNRWRDASAINKGWAVLGGEKNKSKVN